MRLHEDLVLLRDFNAPPAHVPVLSLEGARDHLLDPQTRDAQFPGAQLDRHEKAEGGHLLPREAPQWCADAIRAFAGTLPA